MAKIMQISHTIAPMIKPDFVIAFLIFFIKIRIICLHSSVKEDLGPLSGDLVGARWVGVGFCEIHMGYPSNILLEFRNGL